MTTLITQTLRATALAALLAGAAHAQEVVTSKPSDSGWRFFGLAMATFGGETLQALRIGDATSSEKKDIKAGENTQLTLGVEYGINSHLSASVSLGSHFGGTKGTTGEISFDRTPIEMLAHYHTTPQFRLGAGVRKANRAALSSSGVWYATEPDADGNKVKLDIPSKRDYKASTGIVLEGEYFLTPTKNFSLLGRVVQENFTNKASGKKFDGSHFGIGIKAYF